MNTPLSHFRIPTPVKEAMRLQAKKEKKGMTKWLIEAILEKLKKLNR